MAFRRMQGLPEVSDDRDLYIDVLREGLDRYRLACGCAFFPKVLGIYGIDRLVVVHATHKYGTLHYVIEGSASSGEYGFHIVEYLSRFGGDVVEDQLARSGVDGDLTRAVKGVAGFDGLVVRPYGRGSLVGVDDLLHGGRG